MHSVQFSKNVNLKNAYNGRLSMTDVFVIAGAAGLGWVLAQIFFPAALQLLGPLVGAGISFLLVSPSGVPEKQNYQEILLIMTKQRGIYRAIDKPWRVKTFREE